MAASSQDRTARVVGALGGALLLAAVGVLLTAGPRRGLAAAMAALGLVAGLAVAYAGLLPFSRRRRSPVEHLNDAAFVVVLSIVSLLLGMAARPWTAALPGLVGGALAGRVLWQGPDAGPGPADPGPSSGSGPTSG